MSAIKPQLDSLVRPAKVTDAEAIVRMNKELAIYLNEDPSSVELSPERLIELCFGETPKLYAIVAEEAETKSLLGYALYYFTVSTWKGRPMLFVEDVYVDPNSQGSGIGRLLMEDLAHIAIEEACYKIELNVLSVNPAVQFYERLDYKKYAGYKMYKELT